MCNKTEVRSENVAIAMHCNLRPFDAAPVLICFNYDAHTKVEVAWPISSWHYNVSTAHTLCYVVTLTFDPSTLNDPGRSPVFVARGILQMFSLIDTYLQCCIMSTYFASYKHHIIWYNKNFTAPWARPFCRSLSAFITSRLRGSIMHQPTRISAQYTGARLSYRDSSIWLGQFLGRCRFTRMISEVARPELYQICVVVIGPSSLLNSMDGDFRCCTVSK